MYYNTYILSRPPSELLFLSGIFVLFRVKFPHKILGNPRFSQPSSTGKQGVFPTLSRFGLACIAFAVRIALYFQDVFPDLIPTKTSY